MPDDETKSPPARSYTYDWQAGVRSEQLEYWLLPTILSPSTLPDRGTTLEQLSEATDKFTNVTLSIFVNGVEADAKAMIDGLQRNYEYAVAQRAQEVLESAGFGRLSEVLQQAELDARATVARSLREIGVEIPEGDDW